MTIERAEVADLQQILELQYLAYRSIAQLYNDFSIEPLTQTIESVRLEFDRGIFLKVVGDLSEIIGSVRAYIDDNTVYIGKLMVNPSNQGQGIATKLIYAIEREYSVERYELFTGSRCVDNLRLYERLGYVRFKERAITSEITLVYLEKYVGGK